LPAFKSKAALSGRSLQIWIARHRLSLARSTATPDARSDTAPRTPASRWKGSKLERDPILRQAVLDRLKQGWSPEQVAGRLARQQAKPSVSHETIYRFLYAQIARTKDYRWRHYLPRAKAKRGRRGKKGGGGPMDTIQARIPIAQRPAEAADRQTPGHWEADLMMFAKYGQLVLAVQERSSRILLAARPNDKTADLIVHLLEQLLEPIPQQMRRTIAFDNVLHQEVWHPEQQQISLR
jgi:transposase, IS30 family